VDIYEAWTLSCLTEVSHYVLHPSDTVAEIV